MTKLLNSLLLIMFCSYAQCAVSDSDSSTFNNCENLDSVYREVVQIRRLRAKTPIKCLSLNPHEFSQAYQAHSDAYSSTQRLLFKA